MSIDKQGKGTGERSVELNNSRPLENSQRSTSKPGSGGPGSGGAGKIRSETSKKVDKILKK